MNQSPTLGRPADRTKFLVHKLRTEIISGRLGPGCQLPTRLEIERQFDASSVTIQRALGHLRRDGFIVVNGRKGTYVAEHPPHLNTYALVFASHPALSNGWTRFNTALVNEALALQQVQSYKVDIYYNVNQHAESEDFERLVREVQAHRLAGMIFASHPYLVGQTPLLDETGIRRVVVMDRDKNATWPTVELDHDSFLEKATRYLAQAGRKRVGIVSSSGLRSALKKPVEDFVAAAGLRIEPEWIQGVSLLAPEYARNIVHLLMHARQSERPDALIIADDNLIEYATAGLIAAGPLVPQDVEVVAHCNFPWSTPSVLPMMRLGFDTRRVLQACINSVKKPIPASGEADGILIPAQFEHEVETSHSTAL